MKQDDKEEEGEEEEEEAKKVIRARRGQFAHGRFLLLTGADLSTCSLWNEWLRPLSESEPELNE